MKHNPPSPRRRARPKTLNGLYHRRRILLAILEKSGRPVEKIRLQKLLFLFTREQEKPAYHFLPYKYGCYSFQAAEDARILADHYGLISCGPRSYALNKNRVQNEHTALKDTDRDRLAYICEQYGGLPTTQLVCRVYEQYPRYAVRSELIDQPRFSPLRDAVEKERQRLKVGTRGRCLYTVGYEGVSIEQYMTRLMENGVSALADVRYNPFSMKYGFSKNQLRHITQECGVAYRHAPELGIKGSFRKNLVTRTDYDRLFRSYRGALRQKEEGLKHIWNILREHPRTALGCFEREHERCHRGILAEAIHARWGIPVKHL